MLNNALEEYKLSSYNATNMVDSAFNIAYGEKITNINFVGVTVKTAVSANSYLQLIDSFEAYVGDLNYTTISLMVLNANNVPIGTATGIVFDGSIVLCPNINISTTDKLYGCITRWIPRTI